ncbi:hypothetical protein AVEN_24011-1 [Araneus ventricosus]|uniref:HAT C-terminal dimerisation domain-containing protein n=1 Tax=Araneus ventricosus TaxID=182803 RepID=A0A4Y2D0Y7_ARAVE|nr:hypothetical protein AVEN_24011-1 [Araneus ventricosus]
MLYIRSACGLLIETSETELPKFVQSLVENYNELPAYDIHTEIPHLRFLKAAKVPKEESLGWTFLKFLEFAVEYELLESVPNLILALRFFVTLCVSVASRERRFSKLKLIKNYLRSTMNQARLFILAILSIENCVVEGIDFDNAISKFVEQKDRRDCKYHVKVQFVGLELRERNL